MGVDSNDFSYQIIVANSDLTKGSISIVQLGVVGRTYQLIHSYSDHVLRDDDGTIDD